MVVAVSGVGIANQLYDYFFAKLFAERYHQDLVVAETYDYARYDFYMMIHELAIPQERVVLFDNQYELIKDKNFSVQ